MNRIPSTIHEGRRSLNLCGPSRSKGAWTYIDVGTGQIEEWWLAFVIRTGPHFALCRVEENPALHLVRISNVISGDPVGVGDRLIISGLTFPPRGPKAGNAFRLARAVNRPVTRGPGQSSGIIVFLNTTYGFVQSHRTGNRCFFHLSNTIFTMVPRIGQAVTFLEVPSERGWAAIQVQQV